MGNFKPFQFAAKAALFLALSSLGFATLTPPSTCTIGQRLLDDGGQGEFYCYAANTWSYIPVAALLYLQVNVPNGIAGLDSTGKVQSAVLPAGAFAGITWKGTWSSATTYAVNDLVSLSGSSYIAIATGTNFSPDTNPLKWSVLASKGDAGSGGAGLADPGSNGFVVRTALNTTRPGVIADVPAGYPYANLNSAPSSLPPAGSAGGDLSGTYPNPVLAFPISINVKKYGAIGNGIADDQPACQAALNALKAAGGGTLVFPTGTYFLGTYFTGTKTLAGANEHPILYLENLAAAFPVTIDLQGSILTSPLYTGSPDGGVTVVTTPMIDLHGTLSLAQVTNGTLISTHPVPTTNGDTVGVLVFSSNNSTTLLLDSLTFTNFSRDTFVGGISSGKITRNTFLSTSGRDSGSGNNTNPNVGVWTYSDGSSQSRNIVISSNSFDGATAGDVSANVTAKNPQDGFVFGTCLGCTITGNQTKHNGVEAFYLTKIADSNGTNPTLISNNNIDCTPAVGQNWTIAPLGLITTYGVRADATNSTILNNSIKACQSGIFSDSAAAGVELSGGITIKGNIVAMRDSTLYSAPSSYVEAGIVVNNSTNLRVESNRVEFPSGYVPVPANQVHGVLLNTVTTAISKDNTVITGSPSVSATLNGLSLLSTTGVVGESDSFYNLNAGVNPISADIATFSGYRFIGVPTPVVNANSFESGNLLMTSQAVTFTPTATNVGWYRIISSNTSRVGGTVEISNNASYDSLWSDVLFDFSAGGFGVPGATISQLRNLTYAGYLFDQARLSTDSVSGGILYLDVHISTATAPQPITIALSSNSTRGEFLQVPAFNPTVGTNVASISFLQSGLASSGPVRGAFVSLDGTTGVTGATCTAWKNGLCVTP